jgi:hypothetical protein
MKMCPMRLGVKSKCIRKTNMNTSDREREENNLLNVYSMFLYFILHATQALALIISHY